jgi:hypothetical protein
MKVQFVPRHAFTENSYPHHATYIAKHGVKFSRDEQLNPPSRPTSIVSNLRHCKN